MFPVNSNILEIVLAINIDTLVLIGPWARDILEADGDWDEDDETIGTLEEHHF